MNLEEKKAPAVGEGFLRLWLEHTGKKTPGDAPIPLLVSQNSAHLHRVHDKAMTYAVK